MKIKSIEIDLFGPFEHRSFHDLHADIVLVHGRNEAGKSTLMNFIKAIFFGFPRRNAKDAVRLLPVAPHLPRGGEGPVGGRIALLLEQSRDLLAPEIILERHHGKGKSLQLFSPDGAAMDPSEWDHLLGGVNIELYSSVFAFGLDELMRLDALSNDSLANALYGAGMGVDFKRLADLANFLKHGSESIFVPRGHKKEMNRLFSRLQEIRGEIREVADGLEQYNLLDRELKEREQERHEREQDAVKIRERIAFLETLADLWPRWEEYVGLQSRITAIEHELGDRDYPVLEQQDVDTLIGLQQQIDRLSSELSERIQHFRELAAEAEEVRSALMPEGFLADSEAVLGKAALVSELAGRLRKDLGKFRAQATFLKNKIYELGLEQPAAGLQEMDSSTLSIPGAERLAEFRLDFNFFQEHAGFLEEREELNRRAETLHALMEENSNSMAALKERICTVVKQAEPLERELQDYDPAIQERFRNGCSRIESLRQELVKMLQDREDLAVRIHEASKGLLLQGAEDSGGQLCSSQIRNVIHLIGQEGKGLQQKFKETTQAIQSERSAAAALNQEMQNNFQRFSLLKDELRELLHRDEDALERYGMGHLRTGRDILEGDDGSGAKGVAARIERVLRHLKQDLQAKRDLEEKISQLQHQLKQAEGALEIRQHSLKGLRAEQRVFLATGLISAAILLLLFSLHYFYPDSVAAIMRYFWWIAAFLGGTTIGSVTFLMLKINSGISNTQKMLSLEMQDREKLQLQLRKAEHELQQLSEKIREHADQLGSYLFTDHVAMHEDSADGSKDLQVAELSLSQVDKLEQRITDLQVLASRMEALKQEMQRIRKEDRNLLERQSIIKERISSLQQSLSGLQKEFREMLSRAGISDTHQIEDIALLQAELAELAALLRQNEELNEKTGQIELQLREEMEGIFHDLSQVLDDFPPALLNGDGMLPGSFSTLDQNEFAGLFRKMDQVLEDGRERLSGMEKRFQSLFRLRNEIQRLEDRVEECCNKARDLQKREEQLAQEAEKLQQRWEQFVSAALPGVSVSIDASREFVQDLRGALNIREQLHELMEAIQRDYGELMAIRREFFQIAENYSLEPPVPLSADESGESFYHINLGILDQFPELFHWLENLAQKEEDTRKELQRLKTELSSFRQIIRSLAFTLHGNRKELLSSLKQLGFHDLAQLQRVFGLQREKRGAESELATIQQILSGRLGVEENRLPELFSRHSLSAVNARVNSLEPELHRLEEELRQLQESITHIRSRLLNLQNQERLEELRQDEAGVLQEMNRLARRWAVYKITEHLIVSARKRFEEEHQPKVMQRASTIFAELTSGRWAGIVAPAGEKTLMAKGSTGVRVAPERLSRGTAEQFYLAMRLGYLSSYDLGSERLPVIFDDILVNFDPERQKAAARAISHLARERQVFFFTCHPGSLELMQKTAGVSQALIHLD